jgi:uncharacterized protein YdeI (YjbR/CyaY-like superfamily)
MCVSSVNVQKKWDAPRGFQGKSDIATYMAEMAATPRTQVLVESRAALRSWLKENAASSMGLWLVTYKKTSGSKHLPHDEIVEELICFGWIDSLPRALDETKTQLYIAPRKNGSAWSAANKARAHKMIAGNLMTVLGLRQIEIAKADGKWDFLNDVQQGLVPEDLVRAFKMHKASASNFDTFPTSVKRGILEWIKQAKKPETRAKRVEETARLAAKNIRANQWRQ